MVRDIKNEAEIIHNALNSARPAIKFEAEHPTNENSISLLDITLKIIKDGTVQHEFYQKKAKAKLLPHFKSAFPTTTKKTILMNEIKRRQETCSSPDKAAKHTDEFQKTILMNGYPPNFLQRRQENKTKNRGATNITKPRDIDYTDFEMPYINDRVDKEVRKIFREVGLPVRLYCRSYSLRNALRPTTKAKQCKIKDCKLKNTLCQAKNCVYQIKCTKCHQIYIGSTIRPFHHRFKEHLTDEKSSVHAHQQACHASFETKILARSNDPVKLRFKEAMLILQHGATINSRAEREELLHLIY